MTGTLHLASCLQGSSVLWQVSAPHSSYSIMWTGVAPTSRHAARLSCVPSCCEHSCVTFCVDNCVFLSLGYISRSGAAGLYGSSQFNILLPDCFLRQLHRFTFLPAACEGSNFSTSSPTLIYLFDCNHPSGCEELSHMVLICMSLMANDAEHFSHVLN